MNPTRVLAIDYGTRRIGVAIGDDATRLAGPLDMLEGLGDSAAVNRIADLVRREAVDRVVVGLPLHMDGSPSPQTRRTVAFVRALQQALAVPVLAVDERLSSFAAGESLVEQQQRGRRLTRDQKKRRIDALAATHILQGYLDGGANPIDPDRFDR